MQELHLIFNIGNYDKWRWAHYGVWISFSWQFTDNARQSQPHSRTRAEELKLITGHLTSLRILFAVGCLNSRHHRRSIRFETGCVCKRDGEK